MPSKSKRNKRFSLEPFSLLLPGSRVSVAHSAKTVQCLRGTLGSHFLQVTSYSRSYSQAVTLFPLITQRGQMLSCCCCWTEGGKWMRWIQVCNRCDVCPCRSILRLRPMTRLLLPFKLTSFLSSSLHFCPVFHVRQQTHMACMCSLLLCFCCSDVQSDHHHCRDVDDDSTRNAHPGSDEAAEG